MGSFSTCRCHSSTVMLVNTVCVDNLIPVTVVFDLKTKSLRIYRDSDSDVCCVGSDAGEAEGGQQTEHAAVAELGAQCAAAQSSGGRGDHHQNPGGGADTASAEGTHHSPVRGRYVSSTRLDKQLWVSLHVRVS